LIHLKGRGSASRRAAYLAYYNGFLRPLINRNGMVITVSETSKAEIRSWLANDKVEIVNAGVGLSPVFRPTDPLEPEQTPYFLFVGPMRQHKNLEVVIRALALVPDCELIVVSSTLERVLGFARQHGVGHRVHAMTGVTDTDLAGLYQRATATLLPSTYEGFGLPALESLACGTPVIFWEGCESVAEICEGQPTGIDDAHDEQEWASMMREQLATPKRSDIRPMRVHAWDETAATVSEALTRHFS
jgi:glycosyltransferase involved in cell wall biosynthesis